jgi:hypothetical protein
MDLIQQLEQEEIARLGKNIPAFAPGDTVIVEGLQKARPGSIVKPMPLAAASAGAGAAAPGAAAAAAKK